MVEDFLGVVFPTTLSWVSRKSLKTAEDKDENETPSEEETSILKLLRKQPVRSRLVCSAQCWRMAKESSEQCW